MLINEFEWRIPAADSRRPAQRQTVKENRLVDECSFFHADWQRRKRAKGGRCDSHQIGGISKESENLPARDGDDRFSLKQIFKHGSRPEEVTSGMSSSSSPSAH